VHVVTRQRHSHSVVASLTCPLSHATKSHTLELCTPTIFHTIF